MLLSAAAVAGSSTGGVNAQTGPSSLQDDHLRATTARYATYRESPRPAKKFDFTYPTSLPHTSSYNSSGHPSSSSAVESLYHQYRTGTASSATGGMPPSYSTEETSTERRPSYNWQSSAGASGRMSSSDYASGASERVGRHPSRSAAGPPPMGGAEGGAVGGAASQRSPSQERQGRSYFPTWRTLSSNFTNWQSPISLRRLRTASSDRSSTFDSQRRFQPSYRSWNEKDNYFNSIRR